MWFSLLSKMARMHLKQKNISPLDLIKLRSKQFSFGLALSFKQAAVRDLLQRNPEEIQEKPNMVFKRSNMVSKRSNMVSKRSNMVSKRSNMVSKRSNISPNINAGQMLGEMLDRLNRALENLEKDGMIHNGPHGNKDSFYITIV